LPHVEAEIVNVAPGCGLKCRPCDVVDAVAIVRPELG
jgi:hypothetical protein